MHLSHDKDLQTSFFGDKSVKSVHGRTEGYGNLRRKRLGKRVNLETRMEVLGEEMWTTTAIPLSLYALYSSAGRHR